MYADTTCPNCGRRVATGTTEPFHERLLLEPKPHPQGYIQVLEMRHGTRYIRLHGRREELPRQEVFAYTHHSC